MVWSSGLDGGDRARTNEVSYGIRKSKWVYWVSNARFSARPGCQPSIFLASNEKKHGRAIKDLILKLTCNAHSTLRGRLSIKDEEIDWVEGARLY
jgi:hypothetical protein